MNRLPEFQTEIENNIKIYRYSENLFYYTSEDTFYSALNITWVIGFIVNLICIFGYGYEKNAKTGKDEWLIESYWKWSIVGLYSILGLISFVAFSLWFGFRFPESKMLANDSIKRDNVDLDENSWTFWFYRNFYYSIFLKSIPMMLFLHLTFSITGYFWNPIFHTGHLFLILFLSTTARYVIRSITEHMGQLLMTLLLALFATYTFAMINAMYFRDIFDELDSEGYDLCENMLSCLVYVTDFGLRNGGGIADSHVTLPIEDGSKFYLKIVFNLAFFIFINLVSLNIIFGIIIDTFAELRDDQQARGTPIIS